MTDIIPGWTSYNFHTRVRPGGIIDVNEHLDLLAVGINRRFFQYNTSGRTVTVPYKGTIVTGNEKVLTLLPYAFLVSFLGLLGTIAYAILH